MNIRSLVLLSTALGITACAYDGADSNASNIVSVPGGNGHFGARGLLARSGHTDFDTTTGEFDSHAQGPGEIDRLNLTVFNNDGSVRFTRAFDRVSAPQYSFALDGLARGTAFQINAHVSGQTPEPYADVSIRSIVRLRPDIIVGPDHSHVRIVGPDRWRRLGIVGPDRVRVDQPTTFIALFHEQNGDTGANTKCQLLVDGVQVGTGVSLSVPAGGNTICSITYTFPALGEHQVSISADDVMPDDDNLANNTYTFQVRIVGPDQSHGNGHGFGWGHWRR